MSYYLSASRNRGNTSRSCLSALTLVLLIIAGAAPERVDSASGIALLPHVARYSLTRNYANPDSGIAAIQGMMEVRLEISCDGYRVDQYLGFHVLGNDETQFEHLAYLTSFEDVSGGEFYFDARTFENRQLTEELGGKATMNESGQGETRYSRPESVTEALPDGTVFPVKHLKRIIAAARRGEKSVRNTVFDGSTRENPFEVSTFIGAPTEKDEEQIAALNDSKSWPVRLAYFKVGTQSLQPEFEMSAEVFENGVIGNMIYDYGNFAIDVTLEELETLKKPEC